MSGPTRFLPSDRAPAQRIRRPSAPRGQAEADVVLAANARRADLDLGREHWIGRRKHRAQQKGGRRPEAEKVRTEQGTGQDRERHGEREEPPGNAPPPPAERPIQFQPRTHERDDLGFLGWGVAMLIGGGLLLRAGRP
jgi:hypothetical protein